MTARPHWSDAMEAAEWIRRRENDREILVLFSQLPLLPARLIGQLTRAQSDASTYRCLTRLREVGLIAILRTATIRGHGPALHYLTDLGLATVGLLTGVEPGALARQHRLRLTDLEIMLGQLPHVLGCYKLLTFLGAAQPYSPELVAWEQPFRRRFRWPNRVAPLTIDMPAYTELRNDAEVWPFLLFPDRGTVPLRAVRSTLDRLILFRSVCADVTPSLIVATSTQERADTWKYLLDEAAQRRGIEPLSVRVRTWQELRRDLSSDVGARHIPRTRGQCLAPPAHLEPLKPRSRPCTPLPSLVGDLMDPTPAKDAASAWLGRTAIRLGPADMQLLDIVSRHPFLSLRQLASVLAVEVPSVRRRRNGLITDGLMRLVESDEIGNAVSSDEFVEATVEGLALITAHQGLTPTVAVRHLGLAGGGPEHPIGQRTALIRQLDHTFGVNGVFVKFREMARQLAATGSDDALVEWRNAAACARGHLRPDAYGVYRHRGRLFGFFLEYDRGTMSAHDYAAKFAAYYTYRQSRRFERDYDGFPTVLMVTTDDLAEERIAQAGRAAAVGRDPLPLLLTCPRRLDHPCNRQGLLGSIWRETHATPSERRPWTHSDVCKLDLRKDGRANSDTLRSRQVSEPNDHW